MPFLIFCPIYTDVMVGAQINHVSNEVRICTTKPYKPIA